jgi:hypothetical protein
LGIGFSLLALASAAMAVALVVERGSGETRVKVEDASQRAWRAEELRVEAQDRL